MKLILLLVSLCSLIFATAARAQWQTTTYTLKGGWSSIYLSGDAAPDTLANLPATVTEIWRWNPNPNQIQFTESPLTPSAGTPEWSVWRRGSPADSTLSQLIGRAAYLVKSTGTTANTYAVAIKQAPQPPGASWVRNGANLLGFPTFKSGSNYPTISAYFATFPAAIAANAKVFKYVGGELGPTNPIQIFSTTNEQLDRTQAYWFSAEVVENFYAPLEINLSNSNGLDFGRTGSVITARIRNRSASAVTVTLAPVNSETKPTGQPDIAGPVPLTSRAFNATTLLWTETPITTAYTVSIAAKGTLELQFGVNRAAMTAGVDASYASFLRLTDSGNLTAVILPVRAQQTSLAGLWVGDVKLTAVASKVVGSPGATTPTPLPLRTILHVAEGGSARLLSQVFLGQLDVAPHNVGLCTRESLLKQDAKASAQRLVAAHMPLDQVITGSGTASIPGVVTCVITVPYDDPTNPFVHQYHPDHDNKDARLQPVAAGVESYTITRTCTFTFTTSPPAGSSVSSGWGSSVLGGTYSETISGVHRGLITVSGTFELNRASEIVTLSQ